MPINERRGAMKRPAENTHADPKELMRQTHLNQTEDNNNGDSSVYAKLNPSSSTKKPTNTNTNMYNHLKPHEPKGVGTRYNRLAVKYVPPTGGARKKTRKNKKESRESKKLRKSRKSRK
jgi:hypothetical protein